MEEELRRRRFPVHTVEGECAPVVPLRRFSWEHYLETLHPKLANNLRKGRRRASQVGDLSFEIVRQSPALEELLTEVFEVEAQGWKGEQGTAIRCSPEVEAFYRRIARWAASRESFRLFMLRLNRQLIAFDFCLTNGKTVFALKTGYDQKTAARFSPSNLMRFELLKHLFEEGTFEHYNFLGACLPWKLEWASDHFLYKWIKIYPNTRAGWFAYAARHGWRDLLKHSKAARQIKSWMNRVR